MGGLARPQVAKIARSQRFSLDAERREYRSCMGKIGNLIRKWSELPDKTIYKASCRTSRENVRDGGLIVLGVEQRFSVDRTDLRLRAKQICGSNLDRRCTKCESRRNAPPVGDASGCDDRHFDGIDHLRHQRHCAGLSGNIVAEE